MNAKQLTDQMTDDEMRVKIAELLPDLLLIRPSDILWKSDLSTVLDRDWLAIMHEAEKTLIRDQWLKYICALRRVITKIHPLSDTEHEWLLIRATARQRAEAFLAVARDE